MSSTAALRHGIFKELLPPDFQHRIVPLQDMRRQPTDTVLGEGYDLFGDGSYLAIPLPGHAFGHFGIFWRDQTGPVIYATDAAWTTEVEAPHASVSELQHWPKGQDLRGAPRHTLVARLGDVRHLSPELVTG